MCYTPEGARTPSESLDCQPSSSSFSYRFSNQFAQQSSSASNLNLEDNDFEHSFGAFINQSPTVTALKNQTSQSSILEDSFQQSNDNDPFISFIYKNEVITGDEFQSAPPCTASLVPQSPQISTFHQQEDALQRHRRMIQDQIRRNEQIASILSPWRKRQEQLRKRPVKRCMIPRRKFSLASGLESSTSKKHTGKGNCGAMDSIDGVIYRKRERPHIQR
ncbi:unnamed protein product [Anisakis simplex]|uniref:Uncharacterized protein n=1 Tax=Anisakis simplex TaxID=6269 RepID=A0A0M3IZP4_ANISI|nr:unnamed protein product [Anisakis simplex]